MASDVDHTATVALLARELRKLYPSELQQLYEDENPLPPAAALTAVLNAWAADISSLDEQRAAVCKQEADVGMKQAVLQQLVVGVAGMAKLAQQDQADMGQS
jgi:hypothetical protein